MFIFTNDLNFIKPHADEAFCIKNHISRLGPNDIVLYTKNVGFALKQYNDFCPINILDDLYCLDFIFINANQRGEGYGRRLKKFIFYYFQIVIHTLDISLGFFEQISKDLGLEKINTGLFFGKVLSHQT